MGKKHIETHKFKNVLKNYAENNVSHRHSAEDVLKRPKKKVVVRRPIDFVDVQRRGVELREVRTLGLLLSREVLAGRVVARLRWD